MRTCFGMFFALQKKTAHVSTDVCAIYTYIQTEYVFYSTLGPHDQVSGFGFGGSNANAVLASVPAT